MTMMAAHNTTEHSTCLALEKKGNMPKGSPPPSEGGTYPPTTFVGVATATTAELEDVAFGGSSVMRVSCSDADIGDSDEMDNEDEVVSSSVVCVCVV